ncbi:MAG: DUF924 family protein [Pseudohongiellaceae bacterium]
MSGDEIIKFWFHDIDRSLWFKKDADFDALLRNRFLNIHRQASQGELYEWRKTAEGALAEIIVLDQFSRNMFRDHANAFAGDGIALVLSQEAIRNHQDQQLVAVQKAFLYMPFMHSESATIHKVAVDLFNQPGLENNYKFELSHKAIIDRFGRYPHRNQILQRESTQAELEFLSQPGSSF